MSDEFQKRSDEFGQRGAGSSSEIDDPNPTQPFAPVTWIIIAINIAVFAAMVINSVSFTDPTVRDLIKWGANFGPRSLSTEPWRILTSVFIHIGMLHIAFNMYVLGSSGPGIERAFGSARYLLLYLLSGLGGSIASVCWNPNVVGAGASGAIFGIVGGIGGFYLCRREQMLAEMFRAQMKSLLAFIGYNLLFGIMYGRVDNAAHVGGLVTGFMCGLALTPSYGRSGVGARAVAGTLAIVLLLCGGAAFGWLRASTPAVRSKAVMATMESTTVGKLEIEYAAEIPKETAETLANTLLSIGYGKNRATALVFNENDRVVVGLVVREGAWKKDELVKDFEEIGQQLSKKVFAGSPLSLQLFDAKLAPQRSIPIAGSKPAK